MTRQELLEKAISIPMHEENAVPAKQLAQMWNTNERAVRDIVQDMREQGFWVCSGNNGYFLASDVLETEHFVRRMFAHAIQELRAIKHMRKALKEEGIRI